MDSANKNPRISRNPKRVKEPVAALALRVRLDCREDYQTERILTFPRAIRTGNLPLAATHLGRRRQGEKQSLRDWNFILTDSTTENDLITLIDKFMDLH